MAETVQLGEGISIEIGAGLRVQVDGIDFTFTSRFLGTFDTDDVLKTRPPDQAALPFGGRAFPQTDGRQ